MDSGVCGYSKILEVRGHSVRTGESEHGRKRPAGLQECWTPERRAQGDKHCPEEAAWTPWEARTWHISGFVCGGGWGGACA